jgi:hypothetical protein
MRTVMLVLTVLVWGGAGLLLGSDQGSAAPEYACGIDMASRLTQWQKGVHNRMHSTGENMASGWTKQGLLDCVNSERDSGMVSYNRSCTPARQAQGTVVELVAYSRCLKVVTQALCMLLVGASAVLLLCGSVLG